MLDKRFWEKYFKVYDNLIFLYPYQMIISKFVEILKPNESDRILDIGSGTGNFYIEFLKYTNNIIGVDLSQEGINIHLAKRPDSKILHINIENNLPFKDNSFNKIYSNNTIYLIDKDHKENIFREINRVLSPGGIFVISNIKKDFNPLIIYIDHLVISFKKHGYFGTFVKVVKLIVPTIKIFYYNILIKLSSKKEKITFFDNNEQRKYLLNSGFKYVSEDIDVYSRQATLNYAIK